MLLACQIAAKVRSENYRGAEGKALPITSRAAAQPPGQERVV